MASETAMLIRFLASARREQRAARKEREKQRRIEMGEFCSWFSGKSLDENSRGRKTLVGQPAEIEMEENHISSQDQAFIDDVKGRMDNQVRFWYLFWLAERWKLILVSFRISYSRRFHRVSCSSSR